ncbi:unnamed protein product [Brassica oleracea var. botrytis]|uniref:Uncharacterized protein n=1 Tax=Brassica oleracea var. oleracea TaxID=109376 RepID=A0A0D3CPF3_BRAOL
MVQRRIIEHGSHRTARSDAIIRAFFSMMQGRIIEHGSHRAVGAMQLDVHSHMMVELSAIESSM